jgi:hypothetical protein
VAAGAPPPLPRSHRLYPSMDFHGERSRSVKHLVTMKAKGRVGYGKLSPIEQQSESVEHLVTMSYLRDPRSSFQA